MTTYLVTTGTLFFLVTVAHLWRMTVERHLATDAWYLVLTLVSALLALWAGRLVVAQRRVRP